MKTLLIVGGLGFGAWYFLRKSAPSVTAFRAQSASALDRATAVAADPDGVLPPGYADPPVVNVAPLPPAPAPYCFSVFGADVCVDASGSFSPAPAHPEHWNDPNFG